MKKTAVPSKPYHKGNVAEDLFAAASRLIETEGIDSLTVRRLCREVGVTAANFYNHYPSLEVLLLDVAAAGVDLLSTATNKVISASSHVKKGWSRSRYGSLNSASNIPTCFASCTARSAAVDRMSVFTTGRKVPLLNW